MLLTELIYYRLTGSIFIIHYNMSFVCKFTGFEYLCRSELEKHDSEFEDQKLKKLVGLDILSKITHLEKVRCAQIRIVYRI